jgi:Protein kinase domain
VSDADPPLADLVEAVADGRQPDLSALDVSGLDDVGRARAAALQDIWEIGQCLAAQTSGSSSSIASRSCGDGTLPGPQPLALPSDWGALSVLEHVGHGRFGDVYRAWDSALEREVALKILRREPSAADETAVISEGRLMARVRHPNVVTIHGAQRIDGRTGLWMEFVHGQTLEAELSERGPMDADAIVAIGIELCAALGAVHAAGLIHRDVKTQNVMRERTGRIVLGDFGTGRELDDEAEGPAAIAGTPAYLAPEIFERRPATPQTDIYSLGTLLFHLATRDYPVKGRTVAELRRAHRDRRTVSLGAMRPDLPTALVAAIGRALDPDPAQRFARAEDFVRALEAARATGRPWLRRAMAVAAMAFAGVIIALLAGVFPRGPEPSPAARLGDHRVVLVTDALNRTGEDVLDGTIEYALQRELSQSPVLTVVPRPRVADTLQLMKKAANTPLDAATSREVALRDGGINALVIGRVEKVGDVYGVSVDVVDPATGATLASVGEPPVAVGDLLKAIGRAAIGVRERLGERLQSIEASRLELQRVTTPSLKALHLFSQAMAFLDGQGSYLAHLKTVEQLLREAIAEDPSFAAAHGLLAETIRGQPGSDPNEVLGLIRQAIALSAGSSEAERLRAEGALAMQGTLTDDPAERRRWIEYGIAKNEAVMRLQPNDYSGLVILTNLYQQLGRPHARYAAQLSDMRPSAWEWAARAAIAALWYGDTASARRYARRGAAAPAAIATVGEVAGSYSWLHLFDAWEAWLRNDVRAAATVADRVAGEFDALPAHLREEFALGLSRVNLLLGRLDRAEAFAAHLPDRPGGSRRTRPYLQTHIVRRREDRAQLRTLLTVEFPDRERAPLDALMDAELVETIRTIEDRARRQPGADRLYSTGLLAQAEGRPLEAVEAFERYLEKVEPEGHFVATRLARAYTDSGDRTRAIARLERFSAQRVPTLLHYSWWAMEWLPIREMLATLYRQKGRIADAEEVEAELRALVAVADEDHPVRMRLSRITGDR